MILFRLFSRASAKLGAAPESQATAPEVATLSQWQLIRLRFSKHRLAVPSLWIICCLYLCAAFAEFIATQEPNEKILTYAYCPPQLPQFSFSDGLHVDALEQSRDPITLRREYLPRPDLPVPIRIFGRCEPYKLMGFIPLRHRLLAIDREAFHAQHPDVGNDVLPTFFFLGSDRFGRDVFSRLVHGARISLSIGLVSIFITTTLGIVIGGISGFLGGRVDTIIQRIIEIITSFPTLPLWLAIGAVVPPDWSPLTTYAIITVALSLLYWTGMARVVRGKILSLREEDYALAAQLLGASSGRILFRHLVPGFTSHIIVSVSLSVPGMILGETTLSFLGLGLRPPIVSWGVMLQDCLNLSVIADYPWLLMPVGAIVLTVLACNFLGDGMRDAADPYSSR